MKKSFLIIIVILNGFASTAQKKGVQEKLYSYKGEGDSIKIDLQVCFLDSCKIKFNLQVDCYRKDSFEINVSGTDTANTNCHRQIAWLTSENRVLILSCFGFKNDSAGLNIWIDHKQRRVAYVDGFYGINRDPKRIIAYGENGHDPYRELGYEPKYQLFQGKPPRLDLVNPDNQKKK
jgi:hypothetical protein